jgi:hypothetical protein
MAQSLVLPGQACRKNQQNRVVSAPVKSRFLPNRAGDRRFLDLDSGVLVDQDDKRRHHSMATKHRFSPDDDFPVFLSEDAEEPEHLSEDAEEPDFLSEHAEESEQPGWHDAIISMAKKHGFPPDDRFPLVLYEQAEEPGWDEEVIWSRILKTSIALVTAAVAAILLVGNPAAPFANVTASLLDLSPFQPGTDRSTPSIQSTAGAQALAPTATDVPTRDEIAAALKAGNRSQPEIRQPPAEALLNQFQAWATEEDARAQVVQPVQDAPPQIGSVQPVQDAQAQVAQDDPEAVRPVQRHRHLRHVRNARAEIRPSPRARVHRQQDAREQPRPLQDARAPDRPVQNAQPPSLLQSLGVQHD